MSSALSKKERTRRTLVAAALEEIAANGEAFTILDVTRRAEVSNGTFYNHFVDREALLDAVIAEVFGTFVQASADVVDLDDPVRRFATITAMVLEHAVQLPQLATVLLRLQTMPHTDTWADDPFELLRGDLAEAAERGRTTQPPTPALIDLAVGTMLRAVQRITAVGAAPDYQRQTIALLLQAVGLDPAEVDTVAREAVESAPGLVADDQLIGPAAVRD